MLDFTKLEKCRVCGSKELLSVLDLNEQPLEPYQINQSKLAIGSGGVFGGLSSSIIP